MFDQKQMVFCITEFESCMVGMKTQRALLVSWSQVHFSFLLLAVDNKIDSHQGNWLKLVHSGVNSTLAKGNTLSVL